MLYNNLHIKSTFSLCSLARYVFLRARGIERYTGFSPFTASTALCSSESSENSRNGNINGRVRSRARAYEAEGTSRNLFPRLMHDSSIPLY